MASSSHLGALSILPREVRDKIYSYTLNFNAPREPWEIPSQHCPHNCASPQFEETDRTSLLRVSKHIYNESLISLYHNNIFLIDINADPSPSNHSIMGERGFRLIFAHDQIYREKTNRGLEPDVYDVPWKFVPLLQNVHFRIGPRFGVKEIDILPCKKQTIHGPERPEFVPVLDAVGKMCELLRGCRNLHKLMVSVRSIEKHPKSMEKVIDLIAQLRGIKSVNLSVMSLDYDHFVDWALRGCYARYLESIMSMPEGRETPVYVCQEKLKRSQNPKFEKIQGGWLGGNDFMRFEYPDLLDESEDDDDLDSDEFDDELYDDDDSEPETGHFYDDDFYGNHDVVDDPEDWRDEWMG